MPLINKINQQIDKNQGFINIAEFMQLALFDEELGYYKTKNPFIVNAPTTWKRSIVWYKGAY